jgi:isopentenyl diphosphate isomerase/L-lactate dehydrogenase-like FMN-dependent dehydrogenase
MRGDWRKRGYSVAAVRGLARAALPRPVFDFADGGAEDERTLVRNETAFGDWAFLPKPLEGAATRDLTLDLFGHRLSMPVMIGPTGLSGLFAPDGERAAARAAAAAGTGYCLSHGSVCTLEELAATGVTPRWMQVFLYRDRGFTEELARRAQAAGYDGLVLTIDNQFLGNRERDLRNGFSIPPDFSWADRALMATRLPWLLRMREHLPKITFGNYQRPGEWIDLATLAKRLGPMLDPGLSWADVAWLRGIWTGPLILKGVLHPAEAARAVEVGVDGIIVSNHGGRQLDGAAASIEALPGIVASVQGRIPVLLDGGVRRGADVVTALALGAACCLIARPQLWGLAVAGEAGVGHVLEIFRREIDRAMGLMGATSLKDLRPDLLLRRRG